MIKKIYMLLIATSFAQLALAQATTAVTQTQEFGKVSQEDLDLKSCDFEKDANAEVLFDNGILDQDSGGMFFVERHTRVKIFNEFGKGYGSVSITYGTTNLPNVKDIDAETINFENGKIEITKLDKSLIYTEKTDKYHSTLKFALPAVKAGSIIEWKYKWYTGGYPNWYFQNNIPTRYSCVNIQLPKANFIVKVKVVPHVKQAYLIDKGTPDDLAQTKALANIHSLSDEPFMGARQDNLQRMEFLTSFPQFDNWKKLCFLLMKDDFFGGQFTRALAGESVILKQAKAMRNVDDRIAFIFDTVRNAMKWNETYSALSVTNIQDAWDKKVGNSAEINIILYRLLKKAGINSYPMLTSSKRYGKINPFYPNFELLDHTLVYVPVDSAKNYVLDATNKYNLYNTVPTTQLNAFGIKVDPEGDPEANDETSSVFIEEKNPVMQSVFLSAEIKADGKMTGSAELSSTAYNKIAAVQKYKTDGKEKYDQYLRSNNNNIHISAINMDNMMVDSLPLIQKINFNADLAGDGGYIYFNTNFFTNMGPNPFTNELRSSDVDFGYLNNYSINGTYKLPDGYTVATLPKPINVVMPDGSIIFRRVINQSEGTITVRYVLVHKKTVVYSQDYDALRDFYKQMYSILEEPVVLKKS